MLAIIRVFTTQDEVIKESHSKLLLENYGIKSKTYCIPDQPKGIYSEETEKEAVPKIVATAVQAEKEGATSILISCAADPAVNEVRDAVKIPVLGAGSCACAVALALGKKVGVLNLTPYTPEPIKKILGKHLHKEIAPEGVVNTTDLLTDEGFIAAKEAVTLLAKTSDVIIFACTGLTTMGLKAKIEAEYNIPLVDAVLAAGAIATYPVKK